MTTTSKFRVVVADKSAGFSRELARNIAHLSRQAITQRGRFTVAFSGGQVITVLA
jgi:6-phosphogluconolactonase/glucosamine-6-phosphate isomerase/deaminase